MGNNYCIFKKIFLAIGGGGGGSRSCSGLEGGCDTGRYCCGLLCCHLIDLLSHPRSTALITVFSLFQIIFLSADSWYRHSLGHKKQKIIIIELYKHKK